MLGGPSVGRDLPTAKSVSHQEDRWVVESETGMGRACSESPQRHQKGVRSGGAGPEEAPLCSQTEDSPPRRQGRRDVSFSVTHHAQYPTSLFHSSGAGRPAGPPALALRRAGRSGRPAGPLALGLFLVSSRIDVLLRARVGLGGLSRQMDPLSDVCIFFPDESSWLVEVMCVMSVCFCLLFHRHNTSAHF